MKVQVDKPVDNGDKKGGGGLAMCGECRKVLPEFGLAGGLNYVCRECCLKRAKVAVRAEIKAYKGRRTDPETILKEHGAEKLSQTAEGVRVLQRVRDKYRVELLQPHEPEFKKYWGKDVARREKDMAEITAESKRLRREAA